MSPGFTPAASPLPSADDFSGATDEYFQLWGNDSTTVSISTDSILKVKLIAGGAVKNLGSGATATYNCIQYTISADRTSPELADLGTAFEPRCCG